MVVASFPGFTSARNNSTYDHLKECFLLGGPKVLRCGRRGSLEMRLSGWSSTSLVNCSALRLWIQVLFKAVPQVNLTATFMFHCTQTPVIVAEPDASEIDLTSNNRHLMRSEVTTPHTHAPTASFLKALDVYEVVLVTSFVLLHTVRRCTCLLLRNFQRNSCSAQPGQHSHMQASCCPGCALQLLCTCIFHVMHRG